MCVVCQETEVCLCIDDYAIRLRGLQGIETEEDTEIEGDKVQKCPIGALWLVYIRLDTSNSENDAKE